MSQSNFGTIDPATKSGTDLASDLNAWRTALHSNHSGASRPSYIIAGMVWLDTTTNPWILKMYDGAGDITIGTFNTSTNVFTAANTSIDNGSIGLAKLATQAANSMLANVTGGSASPTAVTLAANTFMGRSSAGNLGAQPITDLGLQLVAQATAALMRTVLGLGTMAVQDAGSVAITGGSITGVSGLGNDYPFVQVYDFTNVASLDIDLPASYPFCELDFVGVGFDQNRALRARLADPSGAFYANTTNYVYSRKTEVLASTPTVTAIHDQDTYIGIYTRRALTYAGAEGLNGIMRIKNTDANGRYNNLTWDLWHRNGYNSNGNNSEPDHVVGMGSLVAAQTQCTKLRLYLDSGATLTGKIIVRGRRAA